MKYITDALKEHKNINKSTIFLYSLLQVKSTLKPINTYFLVEGSGGESRKTLICLFHKSMEGFHSLNRELKKHKLFDNDIEDDRYMYYVFDFKDNANDYDLIKAGHYSKVSSVVKSIISLTDNVIGNMGVFPESHYEVVSKSLNCSEDLLIDNVEVISMPCMENETLHLSESLTKEFM